MSVHIANLLLLLPYNIHGCIVDNCGGHVYLSCCFIHMVQFLYVTIFLYVTRI